MNIDGRPKEYAEEIISRANALEQERAERREAAEARRPVGPPRSRSPGLLVAEGDSLFDYPGTDLLEELEDVLGYTVESVAHRGDTLESMAYGQCQLDGLNRKLRRIAKRSETPRAITLSAGGNDIAGEEFGLLLNHARSGLDAINESIVQGLIDVPMRAGHVSPSGTIGVLCGHHFGSSSIPVIVHGYDYPRRQGLDFYGPTILMVIHALT